MFKVRLSPYAKIFYTEWLLEPSSSRYNITIDQTLYGSLDIVRLRRALHRYVTEHLLLNSHIREIDGEPYWVGNDSVSELEYSKNPVNRSELLDFVAGSFNLYSGPLYRFKLLSIRDDAHRFILVIHHILLDGSSTDFGVFETISNYYNNENYVASHSIGEQIKLLDSLANTLAIKLEQNKECYKEFWHKQLAAVEAIDLRFLKLDCIDGDKTSTKNCRPIGKIRFSYGDVELAKLSQIKRKYVITPYIYGQCIFAILLHKYTGQEILAVSYPIAIKEGLDFIYGAQVNTNIIPYKISQTTTVVELLNQSKEFFRSLKQEKINYSYYPITAIIQEGSKDLLSLSFIQPNFKDRKFEFAGITKVEVADEFNIDAVNPFVFEQELRGSNLNYRVRYDKNILNEKLFTNFVDRYNRMFLEILEDLMHGNASKRIDDYQIVNQKQYQDIVNDFNRTK